MKLETSRWLFLAGAALAVTNGACGSSAPNDAAGAPSASTAAPQKALGAAPSATVSAAVNPHNIPIGVPYPADRIVKTVNPKDEAPYAGEKGTLKGTIRIEGDPPPDTGLKIPANCNEAVVAYGKLFRVGLDKGLADAMVAVTEYRGFVPARSDVASITIRGCALAKRTMAVTYGQRVEVSNKDGIESYMPYLDGAASKAVMVAVPGGGPVKLYPQEPGHYMIRDQLPKEFFVSDVFVLAYATHDVTGLDGKYEIKDLPVGKVKVSAFLPVINKSIDKTIEIKAGENTLDLTLTFDAKKDLERLKKKQDKPAEPVGKGPPGPKG